jgi:Uma2 family endonuclease
MSEPYEELLGGEWHLRLGPGERHERICARLHEILRASVANFAGTQILAPRTKIQLSQHHALRPDVALVTAANSKVWLAIEVVNSDDHRTDTFVKKQIYEEVRMPRLWMVDPRYDNVEVYHSTEYGLVLKCILACDEVLSDPLLPEFQLTIRDLFK